MKTGELHDELVAAMIAAGAVDPRPLLPPGYKGKNADAVFVEERAIVEVKSVCDDHAAVAALESRLSPHFKRWAKESDFVIFGTVGFQWDDYPDWLKHKVEDLTAPSVTDQLEKANRQLRDTQKALNWDTSYGIVSFILPNGFNVDPWVIGRISWNQLIRRKGHFPYVDAVMVVTAPVEDQEPTRRPPMFAPLTRRNEAVPHNLSTRIGAAWMNHYARRSGAPVYAVSATEEAFMKMQRPVRLTFEL